MRGGEGLILISAVIRMMNFFTCSSGSCLRGRLLLGVRVSGVLADLARAVEGRRMHLDLPPLVDQSLARCPLPGGRLNPCLSPAHAAQRAPYRDSRPAKNSANCLRLVPRC